MNCNCGQYDAIELFREKVSERIRHTRTLKKRLETIAEHSLGEHKLLKCPLCGQYWQISCAWNWSNGKYLFKVPDIKINEWLSKPYVQPDELLIYTAMMHDYVDKNNFVETEKDCRTDGCANRAVRYSVLCLDHHIESLQAAGALPKEPQGRDLPDYIRRTKSNSSY